MSTRGLARSCLVAACIVARSICAAEPPVNAASSLEGFVTLGPSVVLGEPANPAYSQSLTRVGGFGELGFAYRSSYFIDPFISGSYATLASGDSQLPHGPWGAGGTLEQHVGAWLITPGITADLWRLRLRFGLGVAIVVATNSFHSDASSSSQLVLANQFGLGFNVLDLHRFRLDAEARLITAAGADMTFVGLGVVARGDLVCFGGCAR